MSKIPYLLEKDINQYVGLQEITRLETVSDVATLIEVFEETVRDIDFRKIRYIVKDSENYFYVVVSDGEYDFDLFSFINSHFNFDIKLSSINARYIFPKRLSRGIYEGGIEESISKYEEEDVATSYLDEEELGFSTNKRYDLYHVKTGTTVTIDNKGLIIGRSPKKADYLVRNNNNIGRVHCNLYIDSNGYLKVHDFESLNGTFVNGRRVHVTEDVILSDGDELTLADEEFRVL